MSNQGNDALNQLSGANSNNDQEMHAETNQLSNLDKPSNPKTQRNERHPNQSLENPSQHSGHKHSNFVTQEISEQIGMGQLGASDEKQDPADGSKNHEEPEPESVELKHSQDDNQDHYVASQQHHALQTNKDIASPDQDQFTKKPALFNDAKKGGQISPNQLDGFQKFVDGIDKNQASAKRDQNILSGPFANQQAVPPCASGEQMSGEEAEVNELPDTLSPYGANDINQADPGKSTKISKKRSSAVKATPKQNQNSKYDQSEQEAAYENEIQYQDGSLGQNMENSVHSRMQVDVQSGQLQPYLQDEYQCSGQDINQDMSDQNNKNSQPIEQYPIGHFRIQDQNQSDDIMDQESQRQLQKSLPSASCTTKKTQKQPEQEQEVVVFEGAADQQEYASGKQSIKQQSVSQNKDLKFDEESPDAQKKSDNQGFESAQDEFMDGQEWPREKYLEANQITESDKEFDQLNDHRQQENNSNGQKQDEELINQDLEIDQQKDSKQQSVVEEEPEIVKAPPKKGGKKKGAKRAAKKQAAKKKVEAEFNQIEVESENEQVAPEQQQEEDKQSAALNQDQSNLEVAEKKSPSKLKGAASSKKKKGKASKSKQQVEQANEEIQEEEALSNDNQDVQPVNQTQNDDFQEINQKLQELNQEYDQLNKKIKEVEPAEESARGRRSARRSGKYSQIADDQEPRAESTRKTRSAMKTHTQVIADEDPIQQQEEPQPSTGKQTRSKKGKPAKSSVQKVEIEEQDQEEASGGDEQAMVEQKLQSEAQAEGQADKDVQMHDVYLDHHQQDQDQKSGDQLMKEAEQEKVEAIVDIDQVQPDEHQQDNLAEEQEGQLKANEINVEADLEELVVKKGRPKGKKKKSKSKKKAKARAKKVVQVEQQDQSEEADDQPKSQSSIKQEPIATEQKEGDEEPQKEAEEEPVKEDADQQMNQEHSQEKQSKVGDLTESLSQQRNDEDEFVEEQIKNESADEVDCKSQPVNRDGDADEKDEDKQKSEEDMPQIGLLDDPNKDEFDYEDDQKQLSVDEHDEQQIGDGQDDQKQKSQYSSSERYAQVPHQDDPNDSEFIKSDHKHTNQFNQSEDSSVQSDHGEMAKDLNNQKKTESHFEQSPRQIQRKQSNELDINDDLGLVLEEEQVSQKESQEKEEQDDYQLDIVNKLMQEDQNEDSNKQQDSEFLDSAAKHSDQGPVGNLTGGFQDIDLDQEEQSKSSKPISHRDYQLDNKHQIKEYSAQPEQQTSQQQEQLDDKSDSAQNDTQTLTKTNRKTKQSKSKPKSSKKSESKSKKKSDLKAQKESKRKTPVQKSAKKAKNTEDVEMKSENDHQQKSESDKQDVKSESDKGFHGFLKTPVSKQASNHEVTSNDNQQMNRVDTLSEQQSDDKQPNDDRDMQIDEKTQQNDGAGKEEKVRRKARNEANQFINIASKLIEEEYGQEDYGEDDEEEGEFIPPSHEETDSLPSPDDSNIISEEILVAEQSSEKPPVQRASQQHQKASQSQSKLSKQKAGSPQKPKPKTKEGPSQKSNKQADKKTSKSKTKKGDSFEEKQQIVQNTGRVSRSQSNLAKQVQSSKPVVEEDKGAKNKSSRTSKKSQEQVQEIEPENQPQKSPKKAEQAQRDSKSKSKTRDADVSSKKKQSGKQNFYIERISRREKQKQDSSIQLSSQRSPSKTKLEKKVQATKVSKTERISPRKTRGRAAHIEDVENDKANKKVDLISDQVETVVNKQKKSKEGKQTKPKESQLDNLRLSKRASSRRQSKSDVEMQIESDSNVLNKNKSSQKASVSNLKPIIFKKADNQSIVVATKTPHGIQKKQNKESNHQIKIKEAPSSKRTAAKLQFSPKKTRSGPRGVVIESPSQNSINQQTRNKRSNSKLSSGEQADKATLEPPRKTGKSPQTTKKTSEKPSKASKQVQNKAEQSLGLVVTQDNKQTQSKQSKNSNTESKKSAFGFMDTSDAVQPPIVRQSNNIVALKKRGRPRKEQFQIDDVENHIRQNHDKSISLKRIKKSNSVEADKIVNPEMYIQQALDDQQTKKRGRPKKNQNTDQPGIVNEVVNANDSKAKRGRGLINKTKNDHVASLSKVAKLVKYESKSPLKRNIKSQQKALERNIKFVEQNLVQHQNFDNMFVPGDIGEVVQPLGSVWTLAPVSPTKSRSSSPQKKSKETKIKQEALIKNSQASFIKSQTDEKHKESKKSRKALPKSGVKESARSSKQKKLQVADASKAIKKQRGRKSKDGLTLAQRKELIIQKRLEKKAKKQAAKQALIDAKIAKKNAKIQKKLNLIKQKELKKKLKKEKKLQQKQKIKAEKLEKKLAKRLAKELKLQKEKEQARKEKEQKKMQKQKELKQNSKDKAKAKQLKDSLKSNREGDRSKSKSKASASAEKATTRKGRDPVTSIKKRDRDEQISQKKAGFVKPISVSKSGSKTKLSKSVEKQTPTASKQSKQKISMSQISIQKNKAKSISKDKAKKVKSLKDMKCKQKSGSISKKPSLKLNSKKISKNNKKQGAKVKLAKPKKPAKVEVTKKVTSSKRVTVQKESQKQSKASNNQTSQPTKTNPKNNTKASKTSKFSSKNDNLNQNQFFKSKVHSQKSSMSKHTGKRAASRK